MVIGSGLILLTRQLVHEFDRFTIGFSGVSGWSFTLYVLAVLIVLTQPVNRYTLPIILAVAVACRLILIFPRPYLSTDIYRYVWDGIVQHAHISPYRYVPGDPYLNSLRAPAPGHLRSHQPPRVCAHHLPPRLRRSCSI